MTKRVLLGGVLAGVVMFLWGAVSHMALGLGDAGIQSLPGEDKVLDAMRENLKDAGFYFFPGEPAGVKSGNKDERDAAMKAWTDKFKQGPHGILIYHPEGTEMMSPGQLLTQLMTDIAVALVVAFLLGQVASAMKCFTGRVVFAGLIGLITGLAILVPYWNWYGYPANFTIANMVDQVIGFSLGGLVLAAIVKQTAPAGEASPSAQPAESS
ncbi:MAG: hypothetical protein HYY24_13275 [Verrucomicrobia bacterium]|nr:hypothetical protein [Verrucomicrobiota bacterium]